MAHIPALPGTPRYDPKLGLDGMVEKMRTDIKHLREGGVDAIMFCNEDDRPYTFHAGPEMVAAETRVVTELKPNDMPFGVDYLWDPIAAMSVAAATGASFIREVMTGVYESDMGLWAPDVNKVADLQFRVGANHIRKFFNVAPEFCSPLGSRTVGQRARSAVVSSLADVILVSGMMAGEEPDVSQIKEAKDAVGDSAPVFLNTGAKINNIAKFFKVADGVIVGSTLKVDGYTWNAVDPKRVKEFVAAARNA
jgi:membrane complex biogenesis BtpA family protein